MPFGTTNARRRRAGFTLIEMTISVSMLLAIFAVAIPFFRVQQRSLADNAGTFDAHLNARYGVSQMDRELRVAGIGVLDQQPMIVQASNTAVTFNADLVSRVSSDLGSVYYDPDVDSLQTVAIGSADRALLPNSTFYYPDTTYKTNGSPSLAETISFWVSADSTPGHSGEYILWRRVNRGTITLLARGLVILSGEKIFRYYKTDSIGRLVEIPSTSLPIYHSAPVHGSTSGVSPDTGSAATIDSIRTIRIRLTGSYRDPSKGLVYRPVESVVRLLNAGLIRGTSCGTAPSLGVTFTATPAVGKVTLTWGRAIDEIGGEKDVQRYVVFRRASGASSFGEPIASVSAGQLTYSLVDSNVHTGDQWVYGLAAQDCTPTNSSIQSTSTVLVP